MVSFQFKHLPLYLEWAPADMFRPANQLPDSTQTSHPVAGDVKEDEATEVVI